MLKLWLNDPIAENLDAAVRHRWTKDEPLGWCQYCGRPYAPSIADARCGRRSAPPFLSVGQAEDPQDSVGEQRQRQQERDPHPGPYRVQPQALV
jgi:hypothetical protein